MPGPPQYVFQGTFGIPEDHWDAAKAEIRAVLVEKAKGRAMIPYSELVGLVESVNFEADDQRLFAILGQVSMEEHEQGRPLLSVLVVHKTGDMKPGPGFFELAAALGRNTSDLDKTWIDETREVFRYWTRPGAEH